MIFTDVGFGPIAASTLKICLKVEVVFSLICSRPFAVNTTSFLSLIFMIMMTVLHLY